MHKLLAPGLLYRGGAGRGQGAGVVVSPSFWSPLLIQMCGIEDEECGGWSAVVVVPRTTTHSQTRPLVVRTTTEEAGGGSWCVARTAVTGGAGYYLL